MKTLGPRRIEHELKESQCVWSTVTEHRPQMVRRRLRTLLASGPYSKVSGSTERS